MSDNEIKNLIRVSDVFVSLHRSEGFGRGMAEAMALGKPAIATGYSGNLDFMVPGTGLLVDYDLVPVAPGAYPHGDGQAWADASPEHASRLLEQLMDDPGGGAGHGRPRQDLHRRALFAEDRRRPRARTADRDRPRLGLLRASAGGSSAA